MKKEVYCSARDIEGLLGLNYTRQIALCEKHSIDHFQGRKNDSQRLQRSYTKANFEKLCRAAGWIKLPNGNMAHKRYVKDIEKFNSKL